MRNEKQGTRERARHWECTENVQQVGNYEKFQLKSKRWSRKPKISSL